EPDRARSDSSSPMARKRAATVPPIPSLARPPTIRRAPTVPPPDPDRPIGKTLFGGAADLRTPAKPHPEGFLPAKTSPGATSQPRTPAANDDTDVTAPVTRTTAPVKVRGEDIDASRDDA